MRKNTVRNCNKENLSVSFATFATLILANFPLKLSALCTLNACKTCFVFLCNFLFFFRLNAKTTTTRTNPLIKCKLQNALYCAPTYRADLYTYERKCLIAKAILLSEGSTSEASEANASHAKETRTTPD